MAKLNKAGARKTGRPVIVSNTAVSDTKTHEGGPGYSRPAKSELFVTAATTFYGEDTFYETADVRAARIKYLARVVAVEDPLWYVRSVDWLRNRGNLRTVSVVLAAEGAKAMQDARVTWGLDFQRPPLTVSSVMDVATHGPVRLLVNSALQRADEPGEFVTYWRANVSRSLPGGVQRGLQDAVNRLYTEYSFSKYDTSRAGYRFGDVIDLVHPKPTWARVDAPWKSDLYRYAIDKRHDRAREEGIVRLPMIAWRDQILAELREDPVTWFEALGDDAQAEFAKAGLTWENVLSEVGGRVDKATLWRNAVHNMGYMGLLRNLRNMDDAGIDEDTFRYVAERLADPEQVARSRQLPFRFYTAYLHAHLRWHDALENALGLSTHNIPQLPGSTLILVDTSASMSTPMRKSVATPAWRAALFAAALAKRQRNTRVDLHGFADRTFRHSMRPGASVLGTAGQFVQRIGEVGHGTQIASSIRATFTGQDRVFVFTDMQTFPDSGVSDYAGGSGSWYFAGHRHGAEVGQSLPDSTPLYAFNLNAYDSSAIASGTPNRYELGGVTDATFKMVPLLERGESARWPWEE
jgi:hypothetical protein